MVGLQTLRGQQREVDRDLPAEGVARDMQPLREDPGRGSQMRSQCRLRIVPPAAGLTSGHQTGPYSRRYPATPCQTCGVSGVPCSSSHRPLGPLMPKPMPRSSGAPALKLRTGLRCARQFAHDRAVATRAEPANLGVRTADCRRSVVR